MHSALFLLVSLINLFINVIDQIISVLRLKNSQVLRFALIKNLSTVKLMNQKFVTQTFLEKNRVLERFKIEADLQLFIQNNLSTETIFWDVGGCVGNFSIYAAHTGSEVIVFEPDGLTYSSLLTNVFNSNLKNINIFPIGLGDSNKLSNLNMRNFKIANAYNSIDNLLGPTGISFKPEYVQNVCTFKASTLIREYNFKVPSHIKIDVDGNEIEVLLGMGDYLYDLKIKSIFIELDLTTARGKDCNILLVKAGFIKQKQKFNSNHQNYIYQR